jgi:hypothetical protein
MSGATTLRAFACTFALAALSAHATTYYVSRNDDPIPNGCAVDDCSLREAVLDASANPGPTHNVMLGQATYGLPLGGLTAAGSIRIVGYSNLKTTIEGDGVEPVLTAAASASIELQKLAIEAHGAHALDGSVDGDTTLFQVRIPEPDSEVWVQGASDGNGAVLVIESEIHAYLDCGRSRLCNVYGSRMLRLQGGRGGATNVRIEDSVFDGDLAPGEASGVVTQTTRDVNIARTTIQNGGIGLVLLGAPPQSVAIDHLHFVGNERPLRLAAPVDMTIDASEFIDNDNPHGLGNGSGALWISNGGAIATVTRSTFAGNAGSDFAGGAVLVENGASLTLRNSTFSNNTFTGTGVGNPRGAAIGFASDDAGTSLYLYHVTIVPPSTVPDIGISGTAIGGTGGNAGLALAVLNSIVRGSCGLDAGAMDVAVGNIESGGNTCQFAAQDNQVGVSSGALALGLLLDHGGPTRTFKPGASSVAIDAADDALCPATDQRGYPRPFGNHCDVGAVEADADVLFKDGFE